MKRLIACVASLLVTLGVASTWPLDAQSPSQREPPIKLVLLVAADQFRQDYLTRFRDEYKGGLHRLLTQGATFGNAHLEHYPTVTAVGHATMLTGATPAVSGIIGNDWFDRGLGVPVTSVSDPATQLVGAPGVGASPRRMLVGTLGDELKMASRAPAGTARAPKVIGLSLKDRAAILTAGHSADLALWFDTTSGAFVTSTYYRADLPAWAAEFNAGKPASAFAGRTWQFSSDSAASGHPMPTEAGAKLHDAVASSPFGNEMLAALAEAALVGERLGQRGVTDLLTVSFSSNDLVGHDHGPDSPEVRDISLRTDQIVDRLLARVDELLGAGRTLVVFTADHGVAPMPEVQAGRRMPGGRIKREELFGPIQAALEAKYGAGRWLLATAGSSPYLNHGLMAEKGLDPAEVRRVAAAAASVVPHVARVYTREQILRAEVPVDTVGRRILRGYNPQRSGDLEIVLDPYWMRSSDGTTHGTPYAYDTHVPLVFMGPGIRPGRYDTPVALNDLAPTLATLLGVGLPAGSDGRALSEIFWSAPASSPRPTPY